MSWLELIPQEILANLNQIDWVERGTGGLSTRVNYFSGSGAHFIDYGSDALAQAAVDAWLAAANPESHIDVGDVVRIRGPAVAKNVAENINYVVLEIPTDDRDFWVLLGDKTLTIFALPNSGQLALEKIT